MFQGVFSSYAAVRMNIKAAPLAAGYRQPGEAMELGKGKA